MATIKINVMSILAVLAIIFGAIALGLYEADRGDAKRDDPLEHELNMYEAGIALGILISLLVLIITVCDKPDSLTGKTFLMYGIGAILLLAGMICMIVVEATSEGENGRLAANSKDEYSDNIGDKPLRIASYVLAGAELLVLILGAIAPFIC